MHNHRFVRTLRIRQALGLDYPTAASTSPSRDTTIVAPDRWTGFSYILVGRPGPWRQARAGGYPGGQSLAPETGGLDRFARIEIARQAKADYTLASLPDRKSTRLN